MVETEAYRTRFHPDLETLKQRHFPHDPDHPLVLHRNDIINRRGAFSSLGDPAKEAAFNVDFLGYLGTQDYRLITVVIDKKAHEERYGSAAWHPYHYCVVVLLERYCGRLNLVGEQGDVMAESRGGTEDMELKRAYQEVWSSGTMHRAASFFQQGLTSKEIKLAKKQANIAGLQIADLFCHPIKQEILLANGVPRVTLGSFGQQIYHAISAKHNRHQSTGRIDGYGKVLLK